MYQLNCIGLRTSFIVADSQWARQSNIHMFLCSIPTYIEFSISVIKQMFLKDNENLNIYLFVMTS